MSLLRLEYIEAGQLAENPKNWRRHPPEQIAALQSVLADPAVGWAGVLLLNERTGRLIDGHARRSAVPPDTKVPVVIGNWTEEAEAKILATLDPLAGMAETDTAALEKLVSEFEWDESLAAIRNSLDLPDSAVVLDATPQLGEYEFKLIVDCRDERHQAELLARFEAEGLAVKPMTI